ncbi:hypothetical protein [Amycolatopsis coloradensis]|nr:hypothetical protein [Amycolatopsis coloradensis]
MLGHQPFDPKQSFAEQVDATLSSALAAVRAQGYGPEDVFAPIDVSGRTDEEVEIVRERVAAAGLVHAALVDERQPPRPGTVTRASLDPESNSVLTDARAARILGDS